MKKILLVFIALLIAFTATWIVKAKTPIDRPDSYIDGINEEDGVWWNLSMDNGEVDEKWILDPEIPENYLPVPGEEETYMVVDEEGNILQYRQRIKQEDGSWIWKDKTTEIPDNYEAVEGLKDVYKTVDENGNVSYYKYIRNDDNTYAFVPVDEKGNVIEEEPPTDSSIPSNYVHISGNVYAVLNKYGVVIGYKERTLNSDGTYKWTTVSKPTITPEKEEETHTSATEKPNYQEPDVPVTHQNNDGTYTETETLITTETTGGWTTTYQTIVTRTYDSKGKLLSTKKEGPTAISKVPSGGNGESAPNKQEIATTLKAEVARVSTGVNYKTDLANEVLAKLNAERASEGLPVLKMDSNSNAYLIAQARAAAMAKYDYSDYDSPLYGTLATMLKTFGISSSKPSENTWKTVAGKSADEIHSRFMVLDGAREARMSSQYTNVGIAIVQKNGYYYVCEVYI